MPSPYNPEREQIQDRKAGLKRKTGELESDERTRSFLSNRNNRSNPRNHTIREYKTIARDLLGVTGDCFILMSCVYLLALPKGKLIPMVKLLLLFKGMPCLESLPNMWSMPTKTLKPLG